MAERTLTQSDCSTALRVVDHGPVAEYYLTATPGTGPDAPAALFSRIAPLLADSRVEAIQEKIYGLASERERVLQARKAAARDPDLPLTYIEGRPPYDRPLAGVQIWGVAPRGEAPLAIETVECPDGTRGRRWKDNGFELLYLPAIVAPGAGVTEQAEQMFTRASAALASNGLGYACVIRTWIYLARILDWYPELNRVRTAHHQRAGLTRDQGGEILPASTGIQGRCADEACLMDVLALRASPNRVTVRPIRSTSRQNQAASYGSAFSRGIVLERGDHRTVFVSGTASIDAHGASTHPGNAEAQSAAMLHNVAGLLEDQGGGLQDICSATLFCKDVASYEAYRRVAPALGIPDFPTISVLGDICRAELLVELEATAVIGRRA